METRVPKPVFWSARNSLLEEKRSKGIVVDLLHLIELNADSAGQAFAVTGPPRHRGDRIVVAHRQEPGKVCFGHRDGHGILIELDVPNAVRVDEQPPSKMNFALRNDFKVPDQCSNRLPVTTPLV